MVLEYKEPQEVEKTRGRALIHERRPANLTGVYVGPNGIRGWKSLQK